MGSDERRGARRFHLNLPLVVKTPEKTPESQQSVAYTRDVSFRGLYFTVDEQFQAGSSVEFVITLPQEITSAGEVRLRCIGHIVRVERPEQRGNWGIAAKIDRYEFLSDEPE